MEGSCSSDCSVLSAEEQGWWLPAPCVVWVFMFSDVPSACITVWWAPWGAGLMAPSLDCRGCFAWLQQRAESSCQKRET